MHSMAEGKSFERGFSCGTVLALMVVFMEPFLKSCVQILKGLACKFLKKLKTNGSEPALDFAFSLGLIRPCMDQAMDKDAATYLLNGGI